jgi:glycosyltransferase involved in cell wall biosynthesis
MRRALTRLLLFAKRRGWHAPEAVRAPIRRFLISRAGGGFALDGWDRQLIVNEPAGPPPHETFTDRTEGREGGGPDGTQLRCLIAVGEFDVAGSSQVAAFLVRRLPETGLATSVAYTDIRGRSSGSQLRQSRLAQELEAEGVPVTEVDSASDVPALLDSGSFDVIYTHGAPDWWIEHALPRGIPVVGAVHGLFYFDWTADPRWAPLCAGVVAVSNNVRNGLLAASTGLAPEQVKVIENGVDTLRFGSVDRSQARAWLGLTDEYLFVSLGRYGVQKNSYGLVRAFNEVALAHTEAHLVIAGRVDEPAYAQLTQELRDSLPAHAQIHLREHCRSPGILLTAADGFIMNSFYEGGQLTPMEALHYGVPVVLSNTGAAPEQIGDGWGGYLVGNPAGDPRANPDTVRPYLYGDQPNSAELVTAMSQLVDEQEHWRARRQTIAEHARVRFSSDVCLAKHAQVLRDAIANSSRI